MKAVLIDHDDSFTQNLKHWLKPLFTEIEVVNHQVFFQNDPSRFVKPDVDLIVLSPGPKNPADYPQTLGWLRSAPSTTAIYGVCLGLQLMVQSLNGEVCAYSPPLHGKKSKLKIISKDAADLDVRAILKLDGSEVARYHSLVCDLNHLTNDFELLAISADDKKPMWLKHRSKKWMGVQFHPESFLTEDSKIHLDILNSWLNL